MDFFFNMSEKYLQFRPKKTCNQNTAKFQRNVVCLSRTSDWSYVFRNYFSNFVYSKICAKLLKKFEKYRLPLTPTPECHYDRIRKKIDL